MSGDINQWPYPVPAAPQGLSADEAKIPLPFNWRQTILSQYADSDRIVGLIETFFAAVDQTGNFQAFYDKIWNLGTAEGYGLDVWGRIVGVNRVVQVNNAAFFGFAEQLPGVLPWGDPPYLGYTPVFGFAGAGDGYGFADGSFGLDRRFGPTDPNGGGGPFYDGQDLTSNYALTDETYRRLIYAKAAANITNGSIPAINHILADILFVGRGNCYVQEQELPTYFGFAESGNTAPFGQAVFYNGETISTLTMKYVFEFPLSAADLAIVQTSGVLPKPTGVAASISILT